MRMKSNEVEVQYEVTDRTEAKNITDGVTYYFGTIKEATRWIKEIITEFYADPNMVTGYERRYDEFGNYIGGEQFF